jgi:acyl-lipid omega-6 desaturase (Delta-12 desaturase)
MDAAISLKSVTGTAAPMQLVGEAPAPRTGKQLIDATRPFASEQLARSWFALVSTAAVFAAGIWLLLQPLAWPLRLLLALVQGGVIVRGFILYHDHLHSALLRDQPLARVVFWTYGIWVMAPPKVWRETHNYHHAHNAKIVGSHIGSYPMQTTQWWRSASPRERRLYAFVRHPLTVLFAWFTAFFLDMCVLAFLRGKKKRWDSLLSAVVTVGLAAAVISLAGLGAWFWAIFLPHFFACAAGAYLFYAQHNYPDMVLRPRELWSYEEAALESSSYMRMGPVMNWFTGNIGYHHVHHLNPGIPFYRLPEAMAAVPELQNAGVTWLRPRAIYHCFQLKLWDAEQQKMVGYPTAG